MSSKNFKTLSNLNSNNNFLTKNSNLILLGILVSALIIRLFYFPFDTPFSLDVLDFFAYAVNTSNFGGIPVEWFLANNGWPLFISLFFSLIPVESFYDYTNLQRMLSISISVLTVIPIYFLCKKYFDTKISLIGAALFVFNPVLVNFSLLAGNFVLFTMVLTFALYFMLTDKKRTIYLSFFLIGILVVIRFEAFLLIIPFSILLICKFKKEGRKVIGKFFLVLSCFALIILPFSIIDIINHGEDGLTSHVNTEVIHLKDQIIQGEKTGEDWTDDVNENVALHFFYKGFENIFKQIIILCLPLILFLFPYGTFKIFKNLNYKNLVIIMVGFTLLIPAFYAYSRDFLDPKFLLPLMPIFTVLSLFLIQKINEKLHRTTIINLIIFSVIIISSIIMVEMNQLDFERERENFFVAQKVIQLSDGYLRYPLESSHIKGAEIKNYWLEKIPNDSDGHIKRQTKVFDYEIQDTLEMILYKYQKEGLTHIIIDENENRPSFFMNVFHNETKYPFLIKEYDSIEDDLTYKVKIFRIDYNSFNAYKQNIVE